MVSQSSKSFHDCTEKKKVSKSKGQTAARSRIIPFNFIADWLITGLTTRQHVYTIRKILVRTNWYLSITVSIYSRQNDRERGGYLLSYYYTPSTEPLSKRKDEINSWIHSFLQLRLITYGNVGNDNFGDGCCATLLALPKTTNIILKDCTITLRTNDTCKPMK